MTNRRENILQRISDITVNAKTGAGIVTAVRNRGLLSTEKRPASVLLDADESQFTNQRDLRGRQAGMRAQIMRMQPQLFIILDEQRPTNDQAGPSGDQNIGTLLNQMRNALVNAIGADEELRGLLGANGGIVYQGCETDLKSGSALTGQMKINMDFIYPYDPATEGS
jgi:hypothetical protein